MIQVAVGCLLQDNKVLIGRRLARQSFAGQWEFPGGKLEAGESPEQALIREFSEETGLQTTDWQPLISYPWVHRSQGVHRGQSDQRDVEVQLHVFVTTSAQGELQALEGHAFEWCPLNSLDQRQMLVANKGIVRALQLPDRYLITGEFHDQQDALSRLKAALAEGIKLVQLRAKGLDKAAFIELAQAALPLCHGHGAKLMLNAKVEWLDALPQADGLQLASTEIMGLVQRPIANDKWLAVSCHNELELAKALELQADFVLLSPVKPTRSHPGVAGIGWQAFSAMTQAMPIPVYALGGLNDTDRAQAKQQGAQGIAAISGYWPQPI
jgi:8-oxo-dGTP diphosphatase